MSHLLLSHPEQEEREREESAVQAVELVAFVSKMPAMVSINILEAIRDGYYFCAKCPGGGHSTAKAKGEAIGGKCDKCGKPAKWMPPI